MNTITKDRQYYKFCLYGFLKNLRFFDAFLILYLIDKGLPFTQIGILYATREVFINIFEIPSGLIADTYGRKKSLLGSLVAYIISFGIYFISTGFWPFMIAFIFYGIGDAFRTGTHKGMIMDYLKQHQWEDQKVNYYGHTRSWSQRGSAISSLVAGIIVFYSGNYQYIFLYTTIPYLLNLLLILSYPESLNHSANQLKINKKYSIWITLKSFFHVVRKKNVLKLINSSAIHSAYLQALKDYIQPLIVSIGLLIPILHNAVPEKKNGVIIGISYFFIYLITSWASRKSSKWESRNKKNISEFTLLVGLCLGILCGVFIILDLSFLAIFAFIGIYVIENIRKPILTAYISDSVSNEILTSVISAQSLLKTITTAILAIVFGIIADHFGLGTAFISCSFLLMAYMVLLNILQNKIYFSSRTQP